MKNMGKYAESVGIWEHTIGNITHKIKPEEQDNIEFLKVRNKSKEDESILFEGVKEIYFKMVLRSNPSMSDEDKRELRTWIGFNIAQILDDMLIAYKWITAEEFSEMKQRAKQKRMEEAEKKKIN